jgi:hypothetical protein
VSAQHEKFITDAVSLSLQLIHLNRARLDTGL